MIPLSRPDITDVEIAEVLAVLRTPVLSMGPKLAEFEERMAALLGVRHAIAVSSGTAGLHLAVRAAGIMPGSEVITTPFSFVASANVMLFEHAAPVFAEVDAETLNLSPDAVRETIERSYVLAPQGLVNRETGRRLVGLLPVDVFGHPVDIEAFRSIAEQYRLWLIEDACEALGSEVLVGMPGTWMAAGRAADAAVYAFYPNKQLTTGEGGLVATNDADLAARCRAGRNQGRQEGATWLEHGSLGYNYRLDELSAALGVAQLKRFDAMRQRRAQVASWYASALAGNAAVRCPTAAPWARVNWFVYVVRLVPGVDRAVVADVLRARDIETRVYFPPIHLQPLYQRAASFRAGTFPVCEAAAASTLALPFFNNMTEAQVVFVAEALEEGVQACEIRTA